MTLTKNELSRLLAIVVCDMLITEEMPVDIVSARSHAEHILENSELASDPVLELKQMGGFDADEFEACFVNRLKYYLNSRAFAAKHEEESRDMKRLLQIRAKFVPAGDREFARLKTKMYGRSRKN